jgi:hypothetical protein
VRIGYPGGNGPRGRKLASSIVERTMKGSPSRNPESQEKNASTMKG